MPAEAAEILICADNADTRRLLRDRIGRELRVRVASNGREGLERVPERAPDLVLTDVMMPEMSGTELCRHLKSEPETQGIPVVLVTSKAERLAGVGVAHHGPGRGALVSGPRVELDAKIPDRLPFVCGAARALSQVFLNLLENAAEAMDGRGGSVRLETCQEEGAIVVRVRDDGPGIAPEALPRVFEPFYSTKEAGRGTGLGLSISQRIVLDHGGTLDVASEPDRGATFTVRIPLQGDARET